MVDLRPDRNGNTLIITKIDDEGFHRQVALTEDEMNELVRLWTT